VIQQAFSRHVGRTQDMKLVKRIAKAMTEGRALPVAKKHRKLILFAMLIGFL
jgi:hypothetical protein